MIIKVAYRTVYKEGVALCVGSTPIGGSCG